MDAAPLTALAQTQAVRALFAQVAAGTQQNLLAIVGENLEMTFQGMGPQGAQLVLPSGQTLVAQGELPFAQGTQLLVRVVSEAEGTVRLQIQEAMPPTTHGVLQPLLTGEAQPLMNRLSAEQPAESLLPLVQMLKQVLASVKVTAPSVTLPMAQVEKAVTAMPAQLFQPLRQALGIAPDQPLAQALKAWVEAPPPAAGSQESLPTPQPSLAEAKAAKTLEVLATVMQEFNGQMRQASTVPESQRDFMSTWFRGLLAAEGQGTHASTAPALSDAVSKAVASLPTNTAEFLRQALKIPEGQPLAQGLESWLESVLPKAQAASSGSVEPRLSQVGSEIQELAQRFDALVRQAPDFPKSQRAFITLWFRDLLAKVGGGESTTAPGGAKALAPTSSPASEARATAATTQRAAEAASSETAAAAKAPMEEPAFWNKWVRGTVEALADPQVSPREAPFHALQAREGTAYFELPAPWLPQGVVQLWVESDASEGGRPEDDTRRVFMGLHLSNLGDTRLGVELTGTNLRVRVWTEHPGGLAAQQEALTKELAETGRTVTLRILPLGEGSPSLRSMVVGNHSWQGLG